MREEDITVKTFLVIDDNPLMREMISDILKAKGFQVFLAEDGERGFEMLNQVVPDAVILDKLMPKAGGGRFILKTKGIQLPKKPVLVFYSSLVQETYQEADPGIFACVNHYPKSMSPRELITTVEQLMKQHQGHP